MYRTENYEKHIIQNLLDRGITMPSISLDE